MQNIAIKYYEQHGGRIVASCRYVNGNKQAITFHQVLHQYMKQMN